jgi:hypothetical protein
MHHAAAYAPPMDGTAAISRREEEASIRSTTPETRQASLEAFLSSRMELGHVQQAITMTYTVGPRRLAGRYLHFLLF